VSAGQAREASALGDARQPVTSGGRAGRQHGGTRRGQAGRGGGPEARRDAVLRVLMEAYRRDAGPGGLDPN
jgi:hypothetical protein